MPQTEHTQALQDACKAILEGGPADPDTLARLTDLPAALDQTAADRGLRITLLYLAAQKDQSELLDLVFRDEMLPSPQTPADPWVRDSLMCDASPTAAPYVAALLQRDVERQAETGDERLTHHLDALALRDHAADALAAAGYIGRLRPDIVLRLETIRGAAQNATEEQRLDMIAAPIAEHARACRAAEDAC